LLTKRESEQAILEITNIKSHRERNRTDREGEKDLAPCRREVHNQGQPITMDYNGGRLHNIVSGLILR
jgi:hypothetical protein